MTWVHVHYIDVCPHVQNLVVQQSMVGNWQYIPSLTLHSQNITQTFHERVGRRKVKGLYKRMFGMGLDFGLRAWQ